ncbi:sigma-70 family RNA polymerase sigma factor [Myxococcota bacterium]|nr:sigma-70 family RNA polymerase sigma factor [Myxococcota bacterium]MBU1430469.1 sigma-70 family RNA polymerase sigma factor [Myxococcota bacterium]MBU1898825.1 sigma-70 family RNA polymerase sigma factor [Myxococcota bacterium]
MSDSDQALMRVEGEELLKADGFTLYLAEIRRYPLLSREEEMEVAHRYFDDGDVEAGRRLVTGNLRLVVKIALEYRRAWVNVMDLIQEGNIGLSEAVKRFDPERGVRFSSFARYWIRALILQFILKNFRLISFANTRAGRKLFFRLERERNRLMNEFGEATPRQLAESLDVTEEDVVAATALRQPALSLTASRGGDEEEGRALSEIIADRDVDVEGQVVHSALMSTVEAQMRRFASALTDEREIAIWYERLVAEEPIALATLGERFGVSRERVRQVEARMKKKLRAFLTEALGDDLELDFALLD